MSGTEMPQGLAVAAANPATDPETLRQIAFHYPQLRATVASNPSSYQGLLDWLGALGDPSVNEALADRARRETLAERTTVLPAQTVPTAPTGEPAYPSGAAPMSAQMTPAQGVLQAGGRIPDERRGHSRGMRVALTVLIIVALVLLGLVIAIFSGALGGGEPGAESGQGAVPSSTPGGSASPGDTATSPAPSTSPSVEEKYPAPPGAVAAQSFVSPSGNIACDLGADSVSCAIAEHDYAANGFPACDGTTTVVATADAAGLSCGSAVSGGGSALDYGAVATNGHSACASTQDGVSCWNTVSGKSFAVARGGWQTGQSGEITPDQFRW